MKNHCTIRNGQLSDLKELQNLFVDTITTVCTADYNQKQVEMWTSSVENTQRWVDIMTKQFVIVAMYENKIVGFATLAKGNYCDFLYVHKDHLRQGIAQRLLAEIEAEARRLKQTVLTSDVSITAKSFFEKSGFKTLQEQTNIKLGVEMVNYKMAKLL